MSFFGPKNIYTKKQIAFTDAKNSSAMKDLLKNQQVSKILDKPEERKEFFGVLKEKARGGGVSVRTLQETLGQLHEGKKTISKDEAFKLAQAIIPKGYDHYRSTREIKTPASRFQTAGQRQPGVIKSPSVGISGGVRQAPNNLKMNSGQFNKTFSSITPGAR